MNNYKTLVILIGNARGGEETWNTMYSHLLKPLNADLALLFGKTDNKNNSLYKNCKYSWEINEYENWREYYEKNCAGGNWFKIYEKNKEWGLGGGIDNFTGSGSIIFAFRHYLKNNFRKEMLKYDRIILSRSDHYYIDNHPLLPIDNFYVLNGEEHGGVTDRHHIFNKSMIDDALGIVDFINDINNEEDIFKQGLNPEAALLLFYKKNNLIKKTFKCRRVQFTVAAPGDTTRWMPGGVLMPGSNYLKLKYPAEYILAVKTKNEKNNKLD